MDERVQAAIDEAKKRGLIPGANAPVPPDMAAALAEAQRRGLTQAAAPANEFANRKGSLLPISTDAQGNPQFDLSAGLTGSIWDALTGGANAMQDVAEGRLDPISQEAVNQTLPAVTLATPISAASNAMRGAVKSAIPGVVKTLRPGVTEVPSAESLLKTGGEGLDAVRKMGVDYTANSAKSLAEGIRHELEQNSGIFAELSPKTFSILSKLEDAPAVGPDERALTSLSQLVAARRSLQEAAGDFNNPTEQRAAGIALQHLDEFIAKPPAESVVAGSASAASDLFKQSNANYAAGKRSGTITQAEDVAQLNAGVANSGGNIGNQLRQRLAAILKSPDLQRGFSEEELALMRKAATGSASANFLRMVGNVLGGGGGLGREVTAGLGMAVGGALGGFTGAGVGAAGLPIMGALARRGAAKLTESQVSALDKVVRSRSPMFMDALRKTPPVSSYSSPSVNAALTRGLMFWPQQDQQ